MTLGDALPKEIDRVRNEVMPAYKEIGPPGNFALMLMEQSLDAATKAMTEGDVIKMIHAYNDLKGYHT